MKFITYATTLAQFKELGEITLSHKEKVEVIVSEKSLSRYSETSLEELLEIIQHNQKIKLPLVLEWDVLSQESLFKTKVKTIESLPMHEFKAIRVQDPGALHFIKNRYPWMKVQLILENGNHNFVGLSRWRDYLGESFDRLVLSNELSKEHLSRYAESLKDQLEILVFGRILLFYSPRHLLKPISSEELLKHNREAFGTSEESPHSGFPLIENDHGTFMFNVKDLYLLDHMNELRELSLGAIRFDLRFDQSFKYLKECFDAFVSLRNDEKELSLKKNHVRSVIKGFYNINKTDVLFPKLKNNRIVRQDQNYIGEIVDVERDAQMALVVKAKNIQLKKDDKINLVTPEGKNKTIVIKTILDTCKREKEVAGENEIILLPFISGVVAKTQVYLNSKT